MSWKLVLALIAILLAERTVARVNCATPEIECEKRMGTEKILCLIEARLMKRQLLLESKISAEACVLGHQLDRNLFHQATCKTTLQLDKTYCGNDEWICLPNAGNGDVYHLNDDKLYPSVAAARADFSSRPRFGCTKYRFFKCSSGAWRPLDLKADESP